MNHKRKLPLSLLEILLVICLVGMISGVVGSAASRLWKGYRRDAEMHHLISLIENTHALAAWSGMEIHPLIFKEERGFSLVFEKWDGLYKDSLQIFRKGGHHFRYISYEEGLQELKKSGYDTKL